MKNLICKAKEKYYQDKVEECEGDQKKLSEIVDSLLGRGKCKSLPPYEDALSLAEAFREFFITKIQKKCDILSELSRSTKEMTCPPIKSLLKPSLVTLETFTPTTKEEIISIMKKSSKASCILDPIPSNLCRLLPHIAHVIKETKLCPRGAFHHV